MMFWRNTTKHKAAITAAKAGDHKAFARLFTATHQQLFAYAVTRVNDRTAATDIVQDTYTDLWRALPSFTYHSDQEFMGFLFTILKRKLIHYYRKQDHETSELDEQAPELAVVDHVQDVYGLATLLNDLKPEYAEVLRLRYWSELHFAEIATVLEQNENTIKTWHRRALQDLRNLLNEHE